MSRAVDPESLRGAYPEDKINGVAEYLTKLHRAEDYHEANPERGARSRRRLWKNLRRILSGKDPE